VGSAGAMLQLVAVPPPAVGVSVSGAILVVNVNAAAG
jgi:hypothetical protein